MNGGRVPGLSVLRPDLEHHPKPADPFAVSIWPALDVLHDAHGDTFHVGYTNGWWWASPVSGTGERLKAISPDDLIVKMRAAGSPR